ncbi:DUF4003 family protein [Rossellomorea oryzaecorticis]|uniref:DUF4003 family protein n=1 Tax=Rossellomorea oryzaecorticis TaxID=1396505 RepID=A0ABW8VWQ0_9BACI|nr:DUF4003 family protein [[Bacillus] enclensis]MBH9966957.1 DUF4003 domain-containing protein [[Bacillus] enclensis]
MNKIETYKDVYADAKKKLSWKVTDQRSVMLIASLYVTENYEFDGDRLEAMADFIKKEVGFFTTLQSHQRYLFAAMLITRFQDPETAFQSFISTYKALVDEGFSMGAYTYISAMVLISADNTDGETSSRAMGVYKKMRKKHFFLTGQSDYPLAMLLAQRTKDTDLLIDHIEYFYDKLNLSGFNKGNDLQTMSHILSLVKDADPDELVTRCTEIFDCLKEEGIRPKSMFYPQVAMLAFLKNGKDQISEVKEIRESLNEKIRWQKDMNFMMAVNLHLSNQIDNSSLLQMNLSTTIEALIQAQQSATIAAIGGATAATHNGS